MVWSAAAIVAAFGIAHLLAGDRAGLLAALLTAMIPGIYRFARMEMPDAPLAAMAAGAFYFLLWSDGLAHRGRTLLFTAVACLGMLTKQSFPLYIAAPAAYLAAWGLWVDHGEARAKRLKNIGISLGTIAAVVLFAFGPRFSQWLDVRLAVRAYELRADEVTIVDNFKLLLTDGLGPTLAALTFAGLLFWPARDRGTRALLLWLLTPLLVLHLLFGLKSTRYLLPFLPAAAVYAALGLEQMYARWPRRRRLPQVIALTAIVAAAMAHDHLRADDSAFTFESFENRLQTIGIPRPQRLNWSVQPLVNRLLGLAAGERVIMLLDSPFTSLAQGAAWMVDPRLDVVNLFERVLFGRIPAEFEDSNRLTTYLSSAKVIVIKSGYNRDPRNYNWGRAIDPAVAQRVFASFFAVKSRYELVAHFPYPEDVGPILVYERKPETGEALAPPPTPKPRGPTRRELHSAPAPAK
jgi:hypothetical protein